MSRPSAEVIVKIDDENGIPWEVIKTPQVYIITYQGVPVGIRSQHSMMSGAQYKYKRILYSSEASAKLEVKRLNKRFNTDLFSYIILGE